jgi:genome maintenance exonuclease 1
MYVIPEFSQFFTVTDGKFPVRYPSVTKILGALQDKTFLEEWKARVGQEEAARISKEASEFGDALHNRIERYLMGEELEELKTGRLSFTFQSLLGKLRFKKIKPVGIELPLQSHIVKTQGRCDFVGYVDGELVILDWKTSNKPRIKSWNDSYFIQAAAYALCFKEMTGVLPTKLMIVICGEQFCQWETEDLLPWVAKLKEKIREYYKIFPDGFNRVSDDGNGCNTSHGVPSTFSTNTIPTQI